MENNIPLIRNDEKQHITKNAIRRTTFLDSAGFMSLLNDGFYLTHNLSKFML